MNRLLVHCRSLARRAGLTRPLARALAALSRSDGGYERALRDAMAAAIRPGDVVWDVGANVGVYTALALECAGEHGAVVAFEPAPACLRALGERFERDPRVRLVGSALGASCGTAAMILEPDGTATTHRIAAAPGGAGDRVQEVPVLRGDDFLAQGNPCPAVVKIDVEGHEEQVLAGMQALLGRAELRHVFVEVHFGLLEQAGAKMAPVHIANQLAASGLRLTWLDFSHLHGSRAPAP